MGIKKVNGIIDSNGKFISEDKLVKASQYYVNGAKFETLGEANKAYHHGRIVLALNDCLPNKDMRNSLEIQSLISYMANVIYATAAGTNLSNTIEDALTKPPHHFIELTSNVN